MIEETKYKVGDHIYIIDEENHYIEKREICQITFHQQVGRNGVEKVEHSYTIPCCGSWGEKILFATVEEAKQHILERYSVIDMVEE